MIAFYRTIGRISYFKEEINMKLLKCECGTIVEVLDDKDIQLTCCGQEMKELHANTTDGALEKHVPVAEYADGLLQVKVGSVEHPMLPEHYITMIVVEAGNLILRKNLHPGDKPEAVFALHDFKGKAHVYEYCNLHGLWKTDIEIK